MAKLTAKEILAKLQGRTLTFEALTAKPRVAVKTLIGKPFAVESASIETGVGDEYILIGVKTDEGRVETTLPVNEASVSIVAFMQQENAPKLENVTFMRQGHSYFLTAVEMPQTENSEQPSA